MPGPDGIELDRVIARFTERPRIVLVRAYDEHAVDAFALEATDYAMKPVASGTDQRSGAPHRRGETDRRPRIER